MSVPWLTVITVVRNDAAGLRATCASVAEQQIAGVEHLIIDGASTDETSEVLSRLHRSRVAPGASDTGGRRVVSEPDDGIYDAMNKGVRLARGRYLQFLNAGDRYTSPDELAWVAEQVRHRPPLWLRTRVRFVDGAGAPTRPVVDVVADQRFWWGWQHTFHQGAFMHRELFDRVGLFDDSYRVAGDFDLMLRAIEAGITPRCALRVTADVDAGGISTQQWRVTCREMHRSRSADRPPLVRLASAGDWGVRVGVIGARRTARRTAERLLGAQRVAALRTNA